jgi:hypothetical protein
MPLGAIGVSQSSSFEFDLLLYLEVKQILAHGHWDEKDDGVIALAHELQLHACVTYPGRGTILRRRACAQGRSSTLAVSFIQVQCVASITQVSQR